LEERLGDVFTRHLRTLDAKSKASLAEALKATSEPAVVRSAFDLPADQRAAIQNALNETFAAEIHLRFETAPNLVSGIALATNGQKMAWTIAGYLGSLEAGINELLKQQDKPEVKAESKAEAAVTPKSETEPKTEPKPEVKVEPKAKDQEPVPIA
jgi:F-type H+-transporting ATPase subunit b